MRLTFRDADFNALAKLWNEFYPPQFAVDAALIKQNTIDSPVFDWGASCIDVMDDQVLGFVAIKQSSTKLYKSFDQDTSHLSAIAFRSPDSGVDLLSRAKKNLIDRGQSRLLFGMDSRHFFPGCPNDAVNVCSFLMVEGFEDGSECYDLERDLRDYQPPAPLPANLEFRTLRTEDRDALREMVSREFSGRWVYDSLEKFDADGASTVVGSFDGKDLIGFALIQDSTTKLPVSGANWKSSLGGNWGALGPIGVVADRRGQGLGHATLSAGLLELQRRGVHRCIIDWTVLGDFYGRHGFEITRRYQGKTLKLAD